MTEYDDPELERLVRASLDTHADDVDTAAPVAARARTAARRRRGGRVTIGVAVAAVAAVAVTAVVVNRDGPASSDKTPAVSQPTSATPSVQAVPDNWRREYWAGVQVDVPADWGWGTAPARVGVEDDDLYLCGGPGAMLLPDGHRSVNADPARPYVGRPIMLSDACMGGTPLLDPQAPYVWLGADLTPGTSDVGNGYTQETVEVAGTTVTVATDDATLRRRILASVTIGGPCAPSLSAPPVAGGALGDREQDDTLVVCAYRSEEDGSYGLVYGDVLDGAAARATQAVVAPAPVLTGDCLSPQGGEWVTLTADVDAGWSGQYVVDLTCPAITDPRGQMHRLTPAMVRPWAVDGLPVTVYGPAGGKGGTFDSFIGMLG